MKISLIKEKKEALCGDALTLLQAQEGKEYIVDRIATEDEELDAFLFSLGCYEGEPITVVTRIHGGCVVSIKDARYMIDRPLSAAISIKG